MWNEGYEHWSGEVFRVTWRLRQCQNAPVRPLKVQSMSSVVDVVIAKKKPYYFELEAGKTFSA